MLNAQRIQDRIADHYGELSDRLREAADFVVANELDIATHSLRSVSRKAGLAPVTFTRLSQALGFACYEDMRDLCRAAVGRQTLSFSQRAELLAEEEDGSLFFDRQLAASLDNLSRLGNEIDRARLSEVVERLNEAREVLVFGAFSSTGMVEYLGYVARFFCHQLADLRTHGSFSECGYGRSG